MAIYDLTADKLKTPWYESERKTIEVLVDCTVQNLAQNDIACVFKFDKKVVIERVEAIIKTACGSSVTFDMGHYTDAGTTATQLDSIFDGIDGNAAAGTLHSSILSTEDKYMGLYLDGETAAKYLCAKILGAASAVGKVLFRVHYTIVHGL